MTARGSGAGRRVALTFDAEHGDRPATAGNDARLLDTLAELEVRATIFAQGRWAQAYPGLARRILGEGHLLGSHAHHHVPLPALTAAALREEIEAAAEALRDATGADGRPWFRCPFGAGADDPAILAALREAGYRHAGWQVDTEDWDPARSAADVVTAIVEGVERVGDGAVVLLHSWPDPTRDAVAGVVGRLRDAGVAFVRLDELPDPPTRTPWAD